VRDAGFEGREERRAGRNGDLARRTGDLSSDVLRVAAAIIVDLGAFSVWGLASRPPARLARDVATSVRRPLILLRGLLRFAAGVLLIAAGALLLLPLAIGTRTFTVLETWTVLTALLVEQLFGPGARPSSL
jgi:hypothetical protein